MKKIRKIGTCLFLFFFLVQAAGCVWFSHHYEFSQEVDHIAMIDIYRCEYEEDNLEMTMICSLDESMAKQFVADIASLDSYKYFGDFSRTFVGILAYITYENGEAEVLTAYTTAKVDLSGQWRVRVDHFDKDDFTLVILKYVDHDLLPELEQYINNESNGQ